MQSSVSLNLPQTMTVSSTPVAINSPHSWRRRINTMVTDAASPVEPGKQCKRRTNVHYQSEIPHKTPIQDQRGSFKGWHSSLGSEHMGRFHSQVFFSSPFPPNEDHYQEKQQVICMDYMLEPKRFCALCIGERENEMKAVKETWCLIVTSWHPRSLWESICPWLFFFSFSHTL